MADDCLFCAIASGAIPADVVLDDDDVIAFRDIAPQAPVHLLIIPKHHHRNICAVVAADHALAGRLMRTATDLAIELGVSESGFRIVVNTGPDGGQSVDHAHLHLLGQRQLRWPPG